ncbi:MAG: hypothetical protein KGL39_47675 [Patescibacteria group bacterium]|nr:hypothetical protein [Patescibacteria group bacterium]
MAETFDPEITTVVRIDSLTLTADGARGNIFIPDEYVSDDIVRLRKHFKEEIDVTFMLRQEQLKMRVKESDAGPLVPCAVCGHTKATHNVIPDQSCAECECVAWRAEKYAGTPPEVEAEALKVQAEQDRIHEAELERQEAQGVTIATERVGGQEVSMCVRCCEILSAAELADPTTHVCKEEQPATQPTEKQRRRARAAQEAAAAGVPIEGVEAFYGAADEARKPKESEKCAECHHARATHGKSGTCKNCGCPAFYLTALDDPAYEKRDQGLKAGQDDERWEELKRREPVGA